MKTQREATISLQNQYHQIQADLRKKAEEHKGIDRDHISSFLAGVSLPNNVSLEQYTQSLRSFGLTQPRLEVYCVLRSFPELSYSLFLVCMYISVHSMYESFIYAN